MINFREGWKGHLWQGRFSSFPMDENHLLAAALYVEMNPVRANLAKAPEDWPWSSAMAHLCGADDPLVKARPLLELAGNWKTFLHGRHEEKQWTAIRKHERSGRPLGEVSFIEKLELFLGRTLQRKKPGPKGPRGKIK